MLIRLLDIDILGKRTALPPTTSELRNTYTFEEDAMTPNQRLSRMRKSFEKNKSVFAEDYEYFAPLSSMLPLSRVNLRVGWRNRASGNRYAFVKQTEKQDSNLAGHGTWSLVGDRITEHGDHGVFSFTIEKLAGTLHMYGRSPGGGWVDVTGSYCK
jgi:hypothetical protein